MCVCGTKSCSLPVSERERGATGKRIGWRCRAREGRGGLWELSQQSVWSCSGRQIKAFLRLRERDKAEQAAAAEGAADPGCIFSPSAGLRLGTHVYTFARHPQLAQGPPSLGGTRAVRPPSARSLANLHRINRISPVMLVTKPQFHFIWRRPAFPVFHLLFWRIAGCLFTSVAVPRDVFDSHPDTFLALFQISLHLYMKQQNCTDVAKRRTSYFSILWVQPQFLPWMPVSISICWSWTQSSIRRRSKGFCFPSRIFCVWGSVWAQLQTVGLSDCCIVALHHLMKRKTEFLAEWQDVWIY